MLEDDFGTNFCNECISELEEFEINTNKGKLKFLVCSNCGCKNYGIMYLSESSIDILIDKN